MEKASCENELTAGADSSSIVDRNLGRLASLQCTDPGVFVLSAHSFVEGWIRERFGFGMDDASFTFLMNHFIEHVKRKSGGFVQGITSMNAMITAHHDTHGVRHRFAELGRESAETATGQLERFCFLANIGSPERLATLRRYLALWDERRPLGALIEENRAYKALRGREAEEKRLLVERVAEMGAVQKKLEALEAGLRAKERLIEELEVQKEAKDARADAERRDRAAIAEELRRTRLQLAAFEKEREYVALARKLTVFTRTRADYERSIVRLTPEQAKVLEQIRLDADFLVKGAAGTGKTLVLLKAIEKAKTGGAAANLGFDELRGSVALLTYNSTLVKYDRYVASILSPGQGADKIMTADAFFRERLAEIAPGTAIDYDVAGELAKRFCPEGFTPNEFRDEAESIVWGNHLDFASYVEGGFARSGMKKALSPRERAKVWAACEAMAAEMDSLGRLSKAYSRVRILRAAKADPMDPRIRAVDYIFVDEVQDLAAADLRAMKACARRSIVLAGDADQSIYQPGFTLKQAGLDLAGHARVLRSNFRNPIPVHVLAEAYRQRKPGLDPDSQPAAFREGPPPERFAAKDRGALIDLLVQRVRFFRDFLDYDPENICVLAPQNDELRIVLDRLSDAGIPAESLKEREFSFESEGRVRVSTYHSAKGLDFPVVFLLLNRKPYAGLGYEDEIADGMTRNLIYVGMTRAMDHLNVFTLEEPGSGAIADLVACLDAQEPCAEA